MHATLMCRPDGNISVAPKGGHKSPNILGTEIWGAVLLEARPHALYKGNTFPVKSPTVKRSGGTLP